MLEYKEYFKIAIMIVSHKHRFIFIAVAKTGSSSIENTLRMKIPLKDVKKEEYDILQDDIWGSGFSDETKLHKHISAIDLMKLIGDNIWNSYFKFAFVRNPWDIQVSHYFSYKNGEVTQNIQNGTIYSHNIIRKQAEAQKLNFRQWIMKNYVDSSPQFFDQNGKIMMDFVGRFENLQEDFNFVCRTIGLPQTTLSWNNKSKHAHYSKYYNVETREYIHTKCKGIISIFGYEFGKTGIQHGSGPSFKLQPNERTLAKIINEGHCINHKKRNDPIPVGFTTEKNNSEKMKMYAFYTESHKILKDEWFLPSLQDDQFLILEKFDQKCPSGVFETEGWMEMMRHKVDFVIKAICENEGRIFIYSDVDVQFFGQISAIIEREMNGKNMLFQQDDPDGLACAGFFACRGSATTLEFWKNVRAYFEAYNVNDQIALNAMLSRVGSQKHIRWGMLPNTFYSPGVNRYGKEWQWKPGIQLQIPEKIVMHHANWTKGISKKIAQLEYVRSLVEQRKNDGSNTTSAIYQFTTKGTSLATRPPVVSIISSIYDADEYIENFLKDIVRQTFFKQCELILINPNSPGDEWPIIQKYMQKYPNIIYQRLEVDPGLYATWNLAIKMARGIYITNANSDDRRAPHHIEQHVYRLNSVPAVSIACCGTVVTKVPNETWEINSAFGTWYNTRKEIIDNIDDLFNQDFRLGKLHPEDRDVISFNIPHCAPVWKKILHDKYGYFDEENYGPFADWEFWLRCLASGEKIFRINAALTLYFMGKNSYSIRNLARKAEIENRIIKKYRPTRKFKCYSDERQEIILPSQNQLEDLLCELQTILDRMSVCVFEGT